MATDKGDERTPFPKGSVNHCWPACGVPLNSISQWTVPERLVRFQGEYLCLQWCEL